jgi:hypothetical protein
LNHDERCLAAEMKSRGNLPRFAFATDAHHTGSPALLDGVLPRADGAVGNGNDVGNAKIFEELGDLFTGKHG